jgi:hypothetical protein
MARIGWSFLPRFIQPYPKTTPFIQMKNSRAPEVQNLETW